MQRMNRLWRFLELPPSPDEIVLFNKVWLKPWRKFRERVRTADPLPQPGAKASAQCRDSPMLQNVPSKCLSDGPESPLAEQVRQVGPGLPCQDVVSAISRKDDARVGLHLSVF